MAHIVEFSSKGKLLRERTKSLIVEKKHNIKYKDTFIGHVKLQKNFLRKTKPCEIVSKRMVSHISLLRISLNCLSPTHKRKINKRFEGNCCNFTGRNVECMHIILL